MKKVDKNRSVLMSSLNIGDYVICEDACGIEYFTVYCPYYRIVSPTPVKIKRQWSLGERLNLATRIQSNGLDGLADVTLSPRVLLIPRNLTTHEQRLGWMRLEGIDYRDD